MRPSIGDARGRLLLMQSAVNAALDQASKFSGDDRIVLERMAEVRSLATDLIATFAPPEPTEEQAEEPEPVERTAETWSKPAPMPEVHDPSEAVPTLAGISAAHARALQAARRGGDREALAGAAVEIRDAATRLVAMYSPATERERVNA
jgi:hypothetical protein